MDKKRKEYRGLSTADYGRLKIELLGKEVQTIEVEVVDESESGMGLRCLSQVRVQTEDRVRLNGVDFKVLWVKKIDGVSHFGIQFNE